MFNTTHILSNKMLYISYKESFDIYLDLTENKIEIINIIKNNKSVTIKKCFEKTRYWIVK